MTDQLRCLHNYQPPIGVETESVKRTNSHKWHKESDQQQVANFRASEFSSMASLTFQDLKLDIQSSLKSTVDISKIVSAFNSVFTVMSNMNEQIQNLEQRLKEKVESDQLLMSEKIQRVEDELTAKLVNSEESLTSQLSKLDSKMNGRGNHSVTSADKFSSLDPMDRQIGPNGSELQSSDVESPRSTGNDDISANGPGDHIFSNMAFKAGDLFLASSAAPKLANEQIVTAKSKSRKQIKLLRGKLSLPFEKRMRIAKELAIRGAFILAAQDMQQCEFILFVLAFPNKHAY